MTYSLRTRPRSWTCCVNPKVSADIATLQIGYIKEYDYHTNFNAIPHQNGATA